MILEMTLMGKVVSNDHRHNVLLASQAMVATSEVREVQQK